MKYVIKIIFLVASMIFVVGCVKDNSIFHSQSFLLDIECGTELEGTKTQVHDYGRQIYWSPNDSIYIIKPEEGCGVLIGNNELSAPTAKFSGNITLTNGTLSDGFFYGIYPCDRDSYYKDGLISMNVPSVQTATSGSFDPLSFPSLARFKSNEKKISFRNVCGGFRFKVVSSGIKTVIFSGNNNEDIAGKAMIESNSSSDPTIRMVDNPSKTVTLTCEEGLIPGEWYYVSLLPVNLSEGYTITLKTDEDFIKYKSSRATFIKRSVFGELTGLGKELLSDNHDWTKNEFVHKSLLLSFPNCVFNSIWVSLPDEIIHRAYYETEGDIEVAQFLYNSPEPTPGVVNLLSLFNAQTIPFFITDYRHSGDSEFWDTHNSTALLYNTVSGIALNSFYDDTELNINVSLFFREPDEYKIVVLVTEDESDYSFSIEGRPYLHQSDYLTRYVASHISGDEVLVSSAPEVKYRTYKVNVSDVRKSGSMRVLVYVLRPYGYRNVVSNGNFGSYYVDNAFSAKVGVNQTLPIQIKIDSDINDFKDGGSI